MPTTNTTNTRRLAARLTRLAVEIDRTAHQLAADQNLSCVAASAPLSLLANALDELESALYISEEVLCLRVRADYLETAQTIAYPHQPDRAA